MKSLVIFGVQNDFVSFVSPIDFADSCEKFRSLVDDGNFDRVYYYEVDIYKIDSYDTNANTLTITLLENNSGTNPGSTISNGVDEGGLSSIQYLRVLQYADYYCFINDITQSTFRKDSIHMSENGLKCLARIIARKINSMKI